METYNNEIVFSFIEFSTSDSNSALKNTLETYICTTVSKRIEFRDWKNSFHPP